MRTWYTSDHHFGHGRIVGYCDRPWWRPARPEELEPGHHLEKVARVMRTGPIDTAEVSIPGGVATLCVPDVEAMEEALVERWNARVAPEDTVYHLGDFAWWHLPSSEVARIRARLNGEILPVRGNHDQEQKALPGSGEKPLTAAVREVFGDVPHARCVEDQGKVLLVYHYGPNSWGQSNSAKLKHARRVEEVATRQPDLFLHGHSHCRGGIVVRYPGFKWAADGLSAPVEVPAVDMGVEGWGYAPASLDEILERVRAAESIGGGGTVFG